MNKITNAGNARHERDIYSPPCVVRIGDLNRGEGQQACSLAGSGDAVMCNTGNAAGECFVSGNSAGVWCPTLGNSGECPQIDNHT
jgi:hypothetical protein